MHSACYGLLTVITTATYSTTVDEATMSIYTVLIKYVYGTFEISEGVQAPPADIYNIYIFMHVSQTLTDARSNVESDDMVYLTSKGRADKYICRKTSKMKVHVPLPRVLC